jgi:hypothetical protein
MSQDPIPELWSKGKEAEVPMMRQELVERGARWQRIRAAWIGVLLVLLLLGIAVALGLWWR